MQKTKIAWTECTWNPVVGCTKVSPGCDNCCAERMAKRLAYMGKPAYQKVVEIESGDIGDEFGTGRGDIMCHGWNGTTHCDESALDKPLKRKKPTMYFVCSMGDLFHPSVPFEFIYKVWEMAAKCGGRELGHIFQFLTKRPERLLEYTQWLAGHDDISIAEWPRNCWLGVTAENQEMADKRIPILLQIPVAVRFVSIEPMLGEIDIAHALTAEHWYTETSTSPDYSIRRHLDWVICGGESGPGARPMHPDWARSIRDQCQAAGVPFFMKQLTMWKGAGRLFETREAFYESDHLQTTKLLKAGGFKTLGLIPKQKIIKDVNQFPKDLQIREYPKGIK